MAEISTDKSPETLSTENAKTGVPAAPAADLFVTQTVFPNPVWVGQRVFYTITVQNLGPDAAQSALLAAAVPSAVRRVCYTRDSSAVWSEWPGSLALGTLAAGSAATIHITGTVRGCPPQDIQNTATVSSVTYDPNTANNTASVTARVIPPCGRSSTILPDAFSRRFYRHITGTPAATPRRGACGTPRNR